MYNYHSTLIASHPYSSPWWSWPLDMKPMGYYTSYNGNLKSSINAFGHPAIFWTGIIAIIYLIFSMFKHKSLEAAFILLAFIGLYIPYVFVGRLMFIYHFYYAVPFLILALVYMFRDLIRKSHTFTYLLGVYLFIVIAIFFLFYPVLSGYEVPKAFISDYLVWLPKWWL
jgi:dolichyl-phosphate-mannose--protein O-mannosyl transferase